MCALTHTHSQLPQVLNMLRFEAILASEHKFASCLFTLLDTHIHYIQAASVCGCHFASKKIAVDMIYDVLNHIYLTMDLDNSEGTKTFRDLDQCFISIFSCFYFLFFCVNRVLFVLAEITSANVYTKYEAARQIGRIEVSGGTKLTKINLVFLCLCGP